MSMLSNLIEKFKGKAKETAGQALDDPAMRKEGEAQREKAEAAEDAERLEEMADEKQQEAAGYKGEEKSERQSG